ncbi:nonribosomal peptide synthase-like protein, partial [Periconia macrospinosa]
MESTLRAVWAHVLNLSEQQVPLDRPFLALGGDSISAMQVMGQCHKKGITLGVQEILRSRSIQQLATAAKVTGRAQENVEEEYEVPFELTPIQSLWFQLPNQGHGHFNQSFYLRVQQKVAVDTFLAAVEQLVSRHSMLRARFSQPKEGVWQQKLTHDVKNSYRFRSHVVSSKTEIDALIEDSQQCLDYVKGPLIATDLFEVGNEQHAFLVGHHLVVDLVTWRLLLEELEDILKGEALLPPALPFQKWAQLQREQACSLSLDKVLPPLDVRPLDLSYWGIEHTDNTYGNAGHASFELDQSLTSLFLTECHTPLKTEPVEVLLAALIQSWSQVFTDRLPPAVFNEGHGREPWSSDIDISRTVGWFTTLYPVFASNSDDFVETVRKVKDFRRQIPANGRPYFARRCLTTEGREKFKNHWPMEISFNYLGQYQQLERTDALLQPLESMAGETREAGGTADVGFTAPRFALFEISAIVFKGQLKFAFTFNRHMQHQERIAQWVSECRKTLTSMIETLPKLESTPTMSDFPLLSLTEDRFRSMFDRLSKLGVSPSEVEDAYPCSNMQEGLLLSQSKDAGFYAAVTVHELVLSNSRVEWEKVIDAWNHVVQHHPALRTIFLENVGTDEGLYDQIVLRRVNSNIVHLECVDKTDALARIDKQRSVSYENGRSPPHRFTVCSTADGRVIVCLEISHAIMDGHSMSLLMKNLVEAYQDQLRGEGPSYSDYISYLISQPEEESLDYWKTYLTGSEICSFPVLDDNAIVDKELKSIRVDFGGISILDLQNLCNANGITLSNIFHVAWAIALSCYVGSKDVTFGYLTSARDSQDIHRVQDMVGPIINTLVCRVDLTDGSKSVLDILQEVQKDYMDAIPHRHTALAEIQHTLGLSGANLFNTALSYRRLPPQTPVNDRGLQLVEVAPIYDPTEYPVSINIEVSDDDAMVDLDYWTDHLSAGHAANVASTFVRAVENIVFNATQPFSTLDHLSGKQLQQIRAWNVIPETLQECVHHRFESWVATQPDAPAVRGFDGDYTYAELDATTNKLAHHLIELGVGPEVFVPTCFDKSSFAVVAMLAVLKAGGSAVPLDANHPKAALESRVEDTCAQVCLTTSARSEMFEDVVPDVVIVDSVLLDDLPDVEAPACTTVGPQNPAFVIFTSGSTGRPKGVVLEHAAMVTSANAHGANLGVGPGTRFLQFASYTFDNSLEEIFTTLQRGGCVCVPSEEQRMNNIASAIAELDANFMDLTPTVAALLSPTDVPTIKGMALGGEALTKAVVEKWYKHVHLHGQYGPSEASINSAWKDFKNGGEPTNIGRAIGSVSWIVDPQNRDRLVPIGCKGELLIEGPILSRGYLNNEDKTREAFIGAPEWARGDEPNERRFYCTGDLVYYTSEGEMMYLGRKDHQVKLNGQRIELGEIEHHLTLNLPKDAQSAVELVKFNDSKSTKALVGFLCLNPTDTEVAVGQMNESIKTVAKQLEVSLANALPSYYVPSMFLPVTKMPLTTSGKLDRKILRQLAEDIPEDKMTMYRLAGKSGRAPTGLAEVALARLWATVLRLSEDSVGADDSFFRLGGDSIGAMKLVTESRKEGIVISVANIFAHPKLSEMAATINVLSSEELSAEPDSDVRPFDLIAEDKRRQIIEYAASECGVFQDSIDDIYPCSRLQEGLIALSTKEPGAYVAETIYRLPADTDIPRFKNAWNTVIAAESILRTRIIHADHYGFLQVVIRDGVEWKTLNDLQDINESDRHLPSRHGGPLTTYAIAGEGTSSPYFVWTAHHAVYDGWSLPQMLEKVESCYKKSRSSPVDSIPYSRFIKYLSTIDEKQSNDFWLRMFDDISAPQFPPLPSPEYKVHASSQLLHRIPITQKSGMEVTMPSMIRAAWALLLATYSGSDDVLWGETNSGRDIPVPGIENIIGATITTTPMRIKLDRSATVSSYLQEMQRYAAAALPFQFAGIQHIKKLSTDAALACDFQSLLAITAGDSMKDPEGGLWNLESTGTIGTNFFSYALIFSCTVEKEGIHIEAHYDNRVIDSWLVQRLVQQFDFLLQRFNDASTSHSTLGEMEILNPVDEATIAAWNNKPLNMINECIHTLIYENQVSFRPGAIAVDSWDVGAVTYAELDAQSTRLASRLISLGVKPKTFIPFCFDKSGWTIVAILAILKTGAAFVPLDFEAPLLRLREIVSDVKADIILCAAEYEDLCRSIPCNTLVVNADTTDNNPSRHQYTLPIVPCDTPAYVLFTSGSTGKPKGAVIHHRAFVSSSAAYAPLWSITPSTRALQFASYAFDCSLIEMLSVLIQGGVVCVPNQKERTDDLAGVINRMDINWAALTPSLVRTLQPSQVPKLKTLTLVGETMSQQDLNTWADRLTLGNGYGPTECSIVATFNVMTTSTKPNNLGKVVTARGWVVSKDNHDVLAPVGAVGELVMEGGGVGAGYLNNAEKTAEVFLTEVKWTLGADILDRSENRRFYKTGDLVKYNEDGTLLFMGRKDYQAKIRGQRLELSEVEHHLVSDALVQNAIATVPTSGPSANRLVAVVSLENVTQGGKIDEILSLLPQDLMSFNISSIRDRLCERVPSYMVPSLWVAVSRFPLMASGKMDRKRVIQWLERMESATYRSISTLGLEEGKGKANDVESKLQAIFAHVLNLPIEDVRLNQSFLHAGGDSISAMQISSRCRSQGLALSVQDIIRAKSIAQLAASVSIFNKQQTSPTEVDKYDAPFDLTPIQRIFFETTGSAYNHFNQSVILRLSRGFEVDEMKAALTALVTIHPMLRARYTKDGSKNWQQRIESNAKESFRLRPHSVRTANNASMQPIVNESQSTLDITTGPVFSVDLFNIEDTFSQAIAIVAHHLVIDVVSWGVVLEDLQALLSGTTPPPQSLPFYKWQQQQAAEADQNILTKVFPLRNIPSSNIDYWGLSGERNVNGDVLTEDIELSPRDSMLLLGAHDALATEPLDIFIASILESFKKTFRDRTPATIYNEGHGREPLDTKQDLSRTVGWFTTLTPIHLPVEQEQPTNVISTIRWVKDLRERIPGKGRPYFAFAHGSNASRDRSFSRWPVEITFNYLGRMQNLERKDALLQKLDGINTVDIGDHVPRLSVFDITAIVAQGTIKLSFGFNRHMQHQDRIKQWISHCRQTLIEAVDQLLQARSEPSLSDFKLLPLAYNGMAQLSSALPSGTKIADIEDIYPTSPMQQGLLLSQMKASDLYAYQCIFEVCATDTSATINPRKLAEAWQVVVHRHPALRSIFVESFSEKGRMDQIVFKEKPGRISWISDAPDEETASFLRQQPSIDYREFNTPHRFMIAKTNGGRVWVRLDMSHTICDGGSIPNLLNDLARAYDGKLTRSDAGPKFSEFIAHVLQGSRENDVNYWKTYLSGVEPCFFPALNDGKPGPREPSSCQTHIGDTASIQAFCKANGVTLSNVLQLTWALVLHYYTGSSDISFGVVASGRDVPMKNIEEAAGCFVNMLICRLSLAEETPIRQLLQTLQTDSMNARDHQYSSLADVQHELQLPSLFNTVFTFQRRHIQRDPEKTALVYEGVEAADPSEYDVTLNVDSTDEGITVEFSYWKDKVCDAQAQNMAETFEKLLSDLVTSDNTGLAVADLEPLTTGSITQIMDWNASLPPAVRRCIHEIVHEQAQRLPPSAKAVEGWDGTFTYQEFDEFTDQLALHLQTLGVGTETLVPILFEKSSWAVVSQIAIMKAGGAYVPLDPKHPPSRLKQLIEDVSAKVVLCSRSYHEKANDVAELAVIIDTASMKKVPSSRGKKPTSDVTPDNAAYILFTSGTTGKPKGTIVTHEAFCTSAAAFTPILHMDSSTRTFQFASYTFDASCTEILAALTVGGCICVPTENDRMSDLAGCIRRMKCTWTLLTPSVLGSIKPEWVSCLKTLVVGGEAVPGPVIQKWASRICFVNRYGPTETAIICATCAKSNLEKEIVDCDPGTIGKQTGCRAWVVHPHNHHKLMPVGSVGELIAEGYIVARGYLNEPVKTAKAFIERPAWTATVPGNGENFFTTRMYKTGDLVRYNSDGSLTYIGRADSQIKLNGQRIELGEIEFHVKSKFPEGVQSAVDLVSPASRTSSKALAAFFCVENIKVKPKSDDVQPASTDLPAADELLLPLTEDLRDMCKAMENAVTGALPSYMIPSLFFPVSTMPWTAAGKLDRNRLRNMVQNLSKEAIAPYRLTSAMHKRKPANNIEKKIQKLVSTVLNIPASSVGLDDNFMRLGGDSVTAMKLTTAAQKEQLNFTVADILKTPKLSELAAKCGAVPVPSRKPRKSSVEPFSLLHKSLSRAEVLNELADQCHIPKSFIQDAYPTMPLQAAMFALSIKQPGAYVAQHILALPKTTDVQRFKAAFEKTVDDLDILRTRVAQLQSGAFLQTVLVEDPIEWNEITSLDSIDAITKDIPSGLGGKLASYTLVNTPSNEHYFVWTLHHAIYDGWSTPLVYHRVQEIYTKGLSTMPTPPYSAFIKFLLQCDPIASTKFWKRTLSGCSAYKFPQRPSFATSADSQKSDRVEVSIKLPPHQHKNITPANIIRATWAILLAAYTGSHDVVFGETLFGRDVPVSGALEMCGPTLATVPTRIKIDNNASVVQLLQYIAYDVVADRIEHQHVGLSEIKRIDSDAASACDFQNLLIVQNGAGDESGKGEDALWSFVDTGTQSGFLTYPLVAECTANPPSSDGEASLNVEINFDANVISKWEVQRLVAQFESVLQQLNTVGNVRDIHVFSDEDVKLVRGWNAKEPIVVDKTIPTLFLEQAHKTPTSVAVAAHDGELTYAELRDMATYLAHELCGLGAGPGELIPLCMDKSQWAIVAIMGILMSGAAYVPLSPQHPASRHEQIMKNFQAKIVLCDDGYVARFQKVVKKVVAVTEKSILGMKTTQGKKKELPKVQANGDDVAYCMFTSGSTGLPKGVVIQHRAIVSSSVAMRKALNITSSSRVFQFASFVFDVSVLEILTTLTCGAVVCVPSDQERTADLAGAINRLKATWTCLTPSVANVLEGPSAVPTLKTFASAAEALTPETIEKWASGLELINAYGPTENSVLSLVNGKVSTQRDPSNIGFALESARTWLTEPENPHRLAPVGAVGELCVEGPLLASGYLNNPKKTAEVFIEDPAFMKAFSGTARNRIYRTGDLVKYAPDGSVTYLGRKDNQIKLSGQRVELGEIEHHLQADESVELAVILMPKAGPAKRKLVAVVSFRGYNVDSKQSWNTPISQESVLKKMDKAKDRLSNLVPPYMVPTVWVAVPSIPRLASAKLDKKQVGSWFEGMSNDTYRHILSLESSVVEPAVATSEGVKLLQKISARVLNVPVTSIKANKSWLSLGGDSLMAMQFLAQCRKEGIAITLNQVLRAKSLAQLAENITSTARAEYAEAKIDTPFELSPVQRFYFDNIHDDKSAHFNQSFTARLSRHVEPSLVKQTVNAIVQCHAMLRARFSNFDGVWKQMVVARSEDAYEFKVQNISTVADAIDIISETQKKLNIIDGPVFAVNLFNIPNDQQVLFIAAHHLVVDVVSWNIITGDLEESIKSSSPKTSLQKELPFQIWNEKQIAHTLQPSLMNSLEKQTFDVEPANLAFWGLDKRNNLYGDVERELFTLDADITSQALERTNALRTDIVDYFIAAILHAYSRIFIGKKTPTVFNESHGREPWDGSNVDISRTVGWFTTMYPVHVPISEDEDDVLQTVRQVKDSRRRVVQSGREYFAHRFLTPEGRKRFADHQPVEILFNYLGKAHGASEISNGDDASLFGPFEYKEQDQEAVSDVGSKTKRLALFEISASVSDGKIEMSFMYNGLMKNQKGIRRWISECQRTLEEVITSVASIDKPQPTLADFPLLPLDSYSRLDRVIKSLPGSGIPSYDQVEDIYPCGTMQEGMILSQIKEPSSYWSFATFEVKRRSGRADISRIEEAWRRVVQRHAALRTVFVDSVCKGGVFDQIVIKDPDTGLRKYTCEDSQLQTKLDSIKYAELNGTRKPRLPHQFSIVQTRRGRIIVKLEINHAVIDGGSWAIITKDLEDAYEGRLSNEKGPLYSEYIKYLRSMPADAAVNFWKQQLRGVKPCYFPSVPQHSSKQRQLHSLYMKFNRFGEVQDLAERSGVTFANILLAAWALLLRTYTNSSDVCYGYLTSGRNVPIDNIESAIGAFINMLVSRVSVAPSHSLLDVFQKVQGDFIDSLPHQHCSLAQFQHDLGLSGKALFNTAVSVQNSGVTAQALSMAEPGADVEFDHLDAHDPSEFAISVSIDATRGEEMVKFAYWTDSISDNEASNVSSLMDKILTQAIKDINMTVGELDSALGSDKFLPPVVVNKLSPRAPLKYTRRRSTADSEISFRSMRSYSKSGEIPQISTKFPQQPPGVPDFTSLIRSIVSEMVPQVVDQILAKNKDAPPPGAATVNEMTNQMTGMIARKASMTIRGGVGRQNLETGSIRSRRMSTASDAESRIGIAADMVAAAGVMASGALKSMPPDFVERKLMTLWGELLDMVEETIDKDDSFFQLGGDSIIAMRLVGAAREEGLSMTVADVFKNPTFADMARVVRVAGEVIDQVMSQAGDRESITGRSVHGGSSKPKLQLPESTTSAWKDFQSVVSDHAIEDTTDGGNSPPEKTEVEKDEMERTWRGQFENTNGSPPSAPASPPPHRFSQQHRMPTTIFEELSPKSISLLGDPNVESVISKVHVFKGGISDILPVTDFQALAITGTLLESRWMLNHFYLDGPGPLDIRKLKQAAFRVVQAFDILRTVFVPYGDRFLQVILRKLQPDFIFQETDLSLEEFTAELRQKDKEHGPRLGEAFTQFVVAKQKKSGHYRIFIRLSHAQYDGICLPHILSSLQAGYNGLPISTAPSFGQFVTETAKTIAGAHDHWREVLNGSKMTEIVARYGPNYQRSAGRTVTLKQVATLPSLAYLNITHATVLKAAWAATLARIASKSDVVFGHVISGRNSNFSNISSIIGPCLNMVPVRVVYRPEWTVLDLLMYIQDQQTANIPFESLGFRDITRNCTDWPDWTNFSSVLQHNQGILSTEHKFQFGGVEYNIGVEASQEDFADFSILSTSHQVEITLTYAPNSTITPEFAQNVFEMLCTNAITFSEDPYTLLPSPSELTSRSSSTITASSEALVASALKKSSEKAALTLPTHTGLPMSEVESLATLLRSAWAQILRVETSVPPSPHLSATLTNGSYGSNGTSTIDLDSDFFMLGGDIMGLAQLSSILEDTTSSPAHGSSPLKIRVEDLIDKCVFVQQVELLCEERKKVKERESMSPWGEK